MAKLEWIDQRLQNWARWVHGGLAGGLGYSGMRWGAPTASSSDREAVIPTNAVEASETHDEVVKLTPELRQTVEVYYLGSGSRAQMCERLRCATATIDSRLTKAHRLLADVFSERQRRQASMRGIAEAAQQQARP